MSHGLLDKTKTGEVIIWVIKNHTKDLDEWDDMKERAMSFIRLNLSDEELLDVMDEQTT